jgi:hypothetical protein
MTDLAVSEAGAPCSAAGSIGSVASLAAGISAATIAATAILFFFISS